MAVVNATQRSSLSTWGWGILLVLCTLLVVNGVWLYFAVASASVSEQDTGVSLNEVQAAYPTVAAGLERSGRTSSILLAGLGLLAFVVSLMGLKTGSLWAWQALWALVLVLAALTALFLTEGRSDIGLFYLMLATIAAAGQLLAGRSLYR